MPDRRRVILAAVVLASLDASAAQAQVGRVLPDSTVRAIDALFAPYAHSGSPGCAVGVYQNGAVTFARGYCFADLNHDVPITAATRFTVGSVSKQFTAASIALLAQSGRISLDDDVRKYIPELPAYQAPVTIRHLVHHTSGVRDFWELVTLAGWRSDDGYTADDMLNLAAHQKGLNFTPGAEYQYSNTGHLLLGLAIFRPLGMRETFFLDDHTEIVARRAPAYTPAGAGYRIDVWNNDIVGQGGIVTSIADLQKWDENFYDARVGGKSLITLLQTPGTVTGSGPMTYAFGLNIETYRGMRLVQHIGSTGGYRAVIYRFPDAHTSVAMLCNVSTANSGITLLFDPPARGKSPGFVVNGSRVSGLRFERALP